MRRGLPLLFAVFLLCTAASGDRKHVLAALKDQEPAHQCGCALATASLSKMGLAMFAHPFGVGPAWINLDGKDVQLKLLNQVGDSNDWMEKNPVGTVLRYEGRGVGVTVEPFEWTPCPRADESCEATFVDAWLTVRAGHFVKRLKVSGACGC